MNPIHTSTEDCIHCKGTGSIRGLECNDCNETGKTTKLIFDAKEFEKWNEYEFTWKAKGSLNQTRKGKDVFRAKSNFHQDEVEEWINNIIGVGSYKHPNFYYMELRMSISNACNEFDAGCENWSLSKPKLIGTGHILPKKGDVITIPYETIIVPKKLQSELTINYKKTIKNMLGIKQGNKFHLTSDAEVKKIGNIKIGRLIEMKLAQLNGLKLNYKHNLKENSKIVIVSGYFC